MIGRVVGSYEISASIGKGAMGEVYEAKHVTLGRRVAVKVLRGDHGKDDDSVRRFFNEARAASAVEHRGIVEVIDFGRDDSGCPFLVMELLDGESLAARLRHHRPLSIDEALRLVRQVASALGAAHARGIVHRDLKPDNIFLVRDPDVSGGVRAKIVDFGIAKLVDPELRAGVATRTGAVIGTPAYMAPEQCRGSVEVDRRADLYALGCILYEMLTGAPPFVREGLGDLLAAHMFDRWAPVRSLRPDVSAGIEAVLDRLLAKDRDARFAGATELLAALDDPAKITPLPEAAAMGNAPDAFLETLAPPEAAKVGLTSTLSATAAEVAGPPARRRPYLVAAGVATIATIAVVLVVVRPGMLSSSSAPAANTDPSAGNPADAVPSADREPLSVDVLVHDVTGDRAVLPGSTVYSGDKLEFFADVSRPAHLYVMQVYSDGTISVLHPLQEDLPLPRGARQRMPPEGEEAFQLDDVVGDEHLLVIASPQPLADVDRRLADGVAAARSGATTADRLLTLLSESEQRAASSSSSPQPDGSVRVTGAGFVAYDFALRHRSSEERAVGYEAAIAMLTKGKTCDERRKGVAALLALGDRRAIPALQKARFRMRGGVLGIGDSNTNACLKKDAEAAIEALGGG